MDLISEFKQFSFSTKTAIVSFWLGTALLFLHFIFPKMEEILIIGFLYVLFACLINGIVLLNLLAQLLLYKNEREETAIKIAILLSNIPIAIAYLYLVLSIKHL